MFVGSSNNSKSGLENNALAKAILILHPPEYSFVGFNCISGVNPKPDKITDALAGALSASINDNSL